MPTIIIKTQAELDALPDSFNEFTVIELRGGTQPDRLIVKKARGSSHVEAWGSSHVEARGSSHVVAWGSSHVEARDRSHVVAWGSSHVEARGSSHVVARGSSHVVAWGSSHVEARESSHVVARDRSHVVAWGSVSVHNHSSSTTVELFGFAVAWFIAKTLKITLRSTTAQVITPENKLGVDGWLEREGVEDKVGTVTLFKRVSAEFKTQEGTPQETVWAVGLELTHPAWAPTEAECGMGKYHACSRGYFCDEFRSIAGDRYVAIQVETKDLHAWDGGDYPHKIAFRKGLVLHECDKYGVKKTTVEEIKA